MKRTRENVRPDWNKVKPLRKRLGETWSRYTGGSGKPIKRTRDPRAGEREHKGGLWGNEDK